MSPTVTLSIAGTDSGGAAGLAADLATFASLGAHGACVVAAVTAQDTTGVHDVHPVPVEVIEAQLDAVLTDLPVAALKTGMLGSAEAVRLVAAKTRGRTLVVDPVLAATSGASLATDAVVAAYREHLLPTATVVTPNAREAARLLGRDADPASLAAGLAALGPSVVVTGGPDGPAESCTDWVATDGDVVPLTHPAIPTDNDHGTGCTYSAALTVALARGDDLLAAARLAADFTASRLAVSRHWNLGRGRGPIAHTHQGEQ